MAGTVESEGRVEVFYGGVWGTVCDDSWDEADAAVVCAQLGFTGGSEALSRATFGSNWRVPMQMDDVACTGSKQYIYII